MPVTAPMLAYWPAVAVPLAVQVMTSPTAKVFLGQLTTTPWSSVTVTLRQEFAAGVRHDVGPGDGVTHRNQRPGRRVGIFAVGVLLNRNRRRHAKVVAWVGRQ